MKLIDYANLTKVLASIKPRRFGRSRMLTAQQVMMYPQSDRSIAVQLGCMRSYSPTAGGHIPLYDPSVDPQLLDDAGQYLERMGAQTAHKGRLVRQLARDRARQKRRRLNESGDANNN